MNGQGAAASQRSSMQFAATVERAVLGLSRRWLAASIAYGVVLTSLPIVAPVLKGTGQSVLSTPIYFAYAFICHQRPERSIHLNGEQMAFCARDLAIFAGAVGVAAVYAIIRRFLRITPSGAWIIVLAVIPIGVDGVTQLAGLRESTAVLRLVTGSIFSAGLGWYLLPRLESAFGTLESDIVSRFSGRPDVDDTGIISEMVPRA